MVLSQLSLKYSDDELIDLMQQFRTVRERDSRKPPDAQSFIGVSIDGFNHDRRELGEIPEARAFCRRLLKLGFIADLTPSFMLMPPKGFEGVPGCPFGAMEIWAMTEGLMGKAGRVEIETAKLLQFKSVFEHAKEVADSLLARPRPDQKPESQHPELQAGLAAVTNASNRHETVKANEFKIRSLKRAMVQQGQGDCIVLLLDLADPYARQINDEIRKHGLYVHMGQPERPGDELYMHAMVYAPFRELFSPSHRQAFDACAPNDIRVAFMSEGRTLAHILPGDTKIQDCGHVITTEGYIALIPPEQSKG
jgi:hypothetical protein